MTSGSSKSNTPSQADTQSAAVVPIVTNLTQFAEWLDEELTLMLRDNADWQTVDTNRKYFGR